MDQQVRQVTQQSLKFRAPGFKFRGQTQHRNRLSEIRNLSSAIAKRKRLAVTHCVEKLLQRVKLEIGIALFLFPDRRGGSFGIIVAGKENRLIRQGHQLLG